MGSGCGDMSIPKDDDGRCSLEKGFEAVICLGAWSRETGFGSIGSGFS